jgi:RNA-directed DNA polymerase
LKAGYVDKGVPHATDEGTPQGGVISPLLANIALHGMEDALGVRYDKRGGTISKRGVVRYADDVVVFCESKEDAEQVIRDLGPWLAQRGLTLSPEKTRVVHLDEGFDFLGYRVRHYKNGRTKTGRTLLITPGKDAVKKIRDKLRALWMEHKGTRTTPLCRKLNPVIRGWANYHRVVASTRTFNAMDHWMSLRAYRWAKWRHPTKSGAWRARRYWGRLHPQRANTWVFGDKRTGYYLLKFAWFLRRHHILVRGRASPDDPRLRGYWQHRLEAKATSLKAKQRRLARAQDFKCVVCSDDLCNGEELQVHHALPQGDPQRDEERYQQLVHLLCHQQLTKQQLHSASRSGVSATAAKPATRPGMSTVSA